MRLPDSRPLDSGDTFPTFTVSTVDGRTLSIPDGLDAPFKVVLVNRGHWCPFCTAQLKAYQQGLTKLRDEGIAVVSLSADTLEKARGLVEANGLTFPVGHGADIPGLARTLGLYFDDTAAEPYLQSAGFLIGPDGKVLTALYSSGAIGRLTWQDVLGLVQYVKSKK